MFINIIRQNYKLTYRQGKWKKKMKKKAIPLLNENTNKR